MDDLPLTFRSQARTKRITLRFDRVTGQAIVSHPPGVSQGRARAFALEHADWIQNQLLRYRRQQAPGYLRIDAAGFPFQAQAMRWDEAGVPPGNRTALLGWYRAQARLLLSAEMVRLKPAVTRQPTGLSVRDTRSRWGSCSRSGALSFSWRLVLAPPAVLAYVVAHEMAHLEHMNHSPAFWAQCEKLCGSPEAMQSAKRRLRRDGLALLQFLQET